MVQAGASLGPDGAKVWRAAGVGLAHCHFWTTPEEVGETQPLVDQPNGYSLCLDGRLDNRPDLLVRLRQSGVAIGEEASDAQLVLAAYRIGGPSAFEWLVGDFAVVVYDDHHRRLVCACDALGRRPLFYHYSSHRLLCGSTLRQLFCDPQTPRRLSGRTIADYLAAVCPDPQGTFYEGIHRLPAGHWLEATSDGALHVRQYWDPAGIALERNKSADWYAEGFRERFLNAVRARLRTTSTHVGLHVSGGFDSAAVTAAVHYCNERSNLGLDPWALHNAACHPAADERHFMEAVIHRYPMPVETTAAERYWAFRPAPSMIQRADDPYEADYASRLAAELEIARRRGAKVILGGNGGDEIGGNSWYLVDRLLRGKVRNLWFEVDSRAKAKGLSSRALLKTLAAAAAGWLRRSLTPTRRRLPPWINRGFARRLRLFDPVRKTPVYKHPARDDMFHRLRVFWSEPHYSAGQCVYAGYGVELRQPFLDRRLFEWALSVPPFRFGEDGRVKAPLRRALADLLPPSILRRADKGDYLYYWDLGLRFKERPRILGLLEDPVSAELGFVEPCKLQTAYEEYCRGGEMDRRQFWNWLTLEQWLRRTHRTV